MIRIDVREPRDIEQWFRDEKIDIPLRREKLLIGDYLLEVNEKEIIVERKTSDDYVSSLYSKHLNNQLYALSNFYPISFLVVTSNFTTPLYEENITRKTLISSLISTVLKTTDGKVFLIQLETDFDLVLFLSLLHQRMERGDFTRHLSLQGKKSDNEWLVSMYSGLPGVGLERAKKIAEKFPSIISLVEASVEELQTVDSIGKGLANKIYKKIRTEVKRE